jgi:hypothetical protein
MRRFIRLLLALAALATALAALAANPAPLRQADRVGSLAESATAEATDTTNGICTLTEGLLEHRH